MTKAVKVPLDREFTGPVAPAVIVVGAIVCGIVVSAFGPLLVVAPFAAIAVGWMWFRVPGVLLAAYLFLPFYKATLGPLSPVDLTPVLAVLNASQLVLVLRGREPNYGSRLGLALWASLGLVVLAGVTWAGQQSLALDRASFWWALILLPSIASVRVASDLRFLNQFIATGFVIGTIIVLFGLQNLFGLTRLAVIGENTLQTGAITLIVALLAIFWIVRAGPRWAQPFAAALIVLALLESVASGSRGPLIASAIALVFGLVSRLLSGRAGSRQDIGIVALACVAVASLAIALTRLPGQSIARILQVGEAISSGGPLGSSIGARADLFSLATNMFIERPLLGNGTASFAAYTTTHVGLSEFTYPHNDLLQLAAEFGIVGAGLFVALVAIAILRRTPINAAWASVKVLFVFMLALSLSSGDIYGDRLLWGLLVIVISAPVRSAAHDPVGVAIGRTPAHPPRGAPPTGGLDARVSMAARRAPAPRE